jgi:hypothetical protein
MTLSLQAIRNWYSKSRNRYCQYFYNHSTISRANSPADEASAKFSSDSDIFLPLQPFHHCFTTASRRWFSGSFTIVKSRILRSLEAANSPTLPLSPTTASPLLHHSFTPRVFRQLHYCKAANSPTLPLQRLHYRFTIASRDRFCRSFTTALGSFWLKLIHCPIL